MKVEHEEQLQTVKNSLGNSVALLWFNFDAEYTILYSHGNAEDLAGSKSTFVDLAMSLEVNICAYDYSGYGLSEGTCSEKACFSDVNAVYNFLVNKQKIKPSKIILFGRSLGSGPTIHLASEQPNLAGMILQSPLRTAIKTQMPDWIGVVFSKIDIFCNEEKVKKITNFPVFIIHGTDDNVVPYTHGKCLYEKLKAANTDKTRVKMWDVEKCGHNDIEYRKGREFKKRLRKFLTEQIKGQQYKEDDMEEEDAKMNCNENDIAQIQNYFSEMDKQMKVNSLSTEQNTLNNNNNAPPPEYDEMYGKKRKSLSKSMSDKVGIFESKISVTAKDKKQDESKENV